MRSMRAGPWRCSTSPGQLSTSVVVMSWPPCSKPVISRGWRLARAAYTAAEYPAGPDPRMRSGLCLGGLMYYLPLFWLSLSAHGKKIWGRQPVQSRLSPTQEPRGDAMLVPHVGLGYYRIL